MIINWLKLWYYKIFGSKKIADLEFSKLGFTLDEIYENKAIYKKVDNYTDSIHYIEIRLNLINEIHIISYDQNYMTYRLTLPEIDAAMIKVHEIIEGIKKE
ncbi:MAG: hypothetical protein IKR19_07535 [Acholeplasmatales bacterium]|nr:hypothetical protein [Acholeplasmatales bacterium]